MRLALLVRRRRLINDRPDVALDLVRDNRVHDVVLDSHIKLK